MNINQSHVQFGFHPGFGVSQHDQEAMDTLESFVGPHDSRQALAFATLRKLSQIHPLIAKEQSCEGTPVQTAVEKVADSLLLAIDIILARPV